ncbi:hypothetical protein BGZ80_008092, partial [Entomortierella chlamydospora]
LQSLQTLYRQKTDQLHHSAASNSETWTRRHREKMTFNKYRTVEREDQQQRYAIRHHPTKNGYLQDEPTIAKKHQWKPFKAKDENDEGKEAQPSKKAPSMPRTVSSPDPQNKAKLVDAMRKQHPIATLNVGALKANINRIVEVPGSAPQAVRDEALSVIQSAVQFANDIKRRA